MQLIIHRKTVDVDQAAGVDLQNTGPPSPLDTRRINRYPHLQPLDTRYDVLCDPYTYQVRTPIWAHVFMRCNLSNVEVIALMILDDQRCMAKLSSEGIGIVLIILSFVLKSKTF
jgi:hypothetical protein